MDKKIKTNEMKVNVEAKHGVVCSMPKERLGYFGWPTIARMDDGTLVVVSSGLRFGHVDPWGKGVMHTSKDNGCTWSKPKVIHDTPLDDRDGGVISLGGRKLLVAWFTHDTRLVEAEAERGVWDSKSYIEEYGFGREEIATWKKVTSTWTEETIKKWLGSWVQVSEDGGDTWGEPVRVPVSAPHGPIRLANGNLFYLGCGGRGSDRTRALTSSDGGRTWVTLGSVPIWPGSKIEYYHEPHTVELPSGKLIGLIRYSWGGGTGKQGDLFDQSMLQTESEDGGKTWSIPQPLGFQGAPPHLLRHSSGAIICVYGYRLPPYGERAMISRDEGKSWNYHYVLRDDAPHSDLGYPASVELPDGTLFTVYYQKLKKDEKCSLLWTRWHLPE